MYYQGYRPPPQPVGPQKPRRTRRSGGGSHMRRRRTGRMLLALLLVVLLIAALILGIQYIHLRSEVNAVENVYLQNIYVDGIHLGGMSPQQALDTIYAAVDARQDTWKMTLTYQGTTLAQLSYGDLGKTTDHTAVYNLLRQAYELGHTGTLQERKKDIDALKTEPYVLYTTQNEMTDAYLNELLQQLQQRFYQPAVDAYLAYFEPNFSDPFVIQGEQYGQYLDIEPLRQEILEKAASGQSGTLELRPQTLSPSVTAADIRNQVTLISEGITPIAHSSTEDRNTNIRVAFSKINGTVLEPGAQFSFNTTVGNRTLENGFKYAIEYANGDSVLGIGGGVCQASTTIYLAALLSNQEIIKREPHADEVSYTIFGQDATVYYTRDRKIDFSFRNNTNGKLYITAKVEEVKKNNYQCVVRFYGMPLGEGVSYKLRTETVEIIPAPIDVEYRKDTKGDYVTYKDEEMITRQARDGYVNETYLQRWENGVLASETLISRDTCKARSEVIYVGVQDREPETSW